MTELKEDIVLGLMFFVGIITFVGGQFIISTMMFAVSALFTNIRAGAKQSLAVAKSN